VPPVIASVYKAEAVLCPRDSGTRSELRRATPRPLHVGRQNIPQVVRCSTAMTDAPLLRQEFRCPKCKTKVFYDPADPKHRATGVMLQKPGVAHEITIYLTCSNGHNRRYVVDGR
jgi:hypothetical protein